MKDAAAEPTHSTGQFSAQNKYDMSVTPPVSHLEMWPYVRMAAARSENQSDTAVLIVLSSAISGATVGAAVTVGGRVIVGAGLGAAFAVFVEHRYDDWQVWQRLVAG